MSAEIICLQAWRGSHRVQPPANRSVSFPLLLPTWPCGWLQPMLVEIDVGMIVEFGALATRFVGQTACGGFLHQESEPRLDLDHRKGAVIHRLFQAPATKERVARDR